MIVRSESNWVRLLFAWRGSVLPAILPQLAFMLLVSLIACTADGRVLGEKVTTSFTLVGITLAVFLGFRNNVSWARYWESRQLWGSLLVTSRTLVSQVLAFLPAAQHAGFHEETLQYLIALTHALKRQLRRDPTESALPQLTAAQDADIRLRHYRPVDILHRLRLQVGALQRLEPSYGQVAWMLDEQLVQLGVVIGGCERISSTPVPFAYAVLMRRTVFVYCTLLPFGLANVLHYATPAVSVFVAYTLLALEEVSNEISDPFGTSPNDLALDAMCREIERSLLELMNRPLPEPYRVDRDHVLR